MYIYIYVVLVLLSLLNRSPSHLSVAFQASNGPMALRRVAALRGAEVHQDHVGLLRERGDLSGIPGMFILI